MEDPSPNRSDQNSDENTDQISDIRQQPTKFSAFTRQISKHKVVERLKKLSTGSLFNNVPPGQKKNECFYLFYF